MCQWSGLALVQVMACHLFGTKPLPEPELAYCQLASWEQISVKFESEFYYFSFKIMHLKLPSAIMAAILSRGRWVSTKSCLIQVRGFIGSGSKSAQCFLLTHWGRDKMATVFQMTFWNGFSWMKMYEFQVKFHWSLFLEVQLTTCQH